MSQCSVALLLCIVDLMCVGSSVTYLCVRRNYFRRILRLYPGSSLSRVALSCRYFRIIAVLVISGKQPLSGLLQLCGIYLRVLEKFSATVVLFNIFSTSRKHFVFQAILSVRAITSTNVDGKASQTTVPGYHTLSMTGYEPRPAGTRVRCAADGAVPGGAEPAGDKPSGGAGPGDDPGEDASLTGTRGLTPPGGAGLSSSGVPPGSSPAFAQRWSQRRTTYAYSVEPNVPSLWATISYAFTVKREFPDVTHRGGTSTFTKYAYAVGTTQPSVPRTIKEARAATEAA